MQRTLDKTRKQIVKKKGLMGTVHEGSRDSRRLRKALARDGRLGKLATSRKMHEQPFGTHIWWPASFDLFFSAPQSLVSTHG
jgi:hypothetical protein